MLGLRSARWPVACITIAIAGCGEAATTNSSMSNSAPPSSGAASSPTASITASDAASIFSCSPHSGGDPSHSAQLTGVRVAHHDGYDRITFEFGPAPGMPGAYGVPTFTVTPSTSAHFTRDASGAPVTVEGASALKFVAHGASGTDSTGHPTYTGSLDQHSAFPSIREVTELGDFERVLTWGIGLASPACYRVTELTGPARIIIDVQTGA